MIPHTLIILPGWGGTKETWNGFVEKAKPLFQDVQVIELPCFGNEPCPTEVWGVEEYANFVKQKILQSSNPSVILLGHSFGGQVATYLTAKHPELVDKLILSGAAIYRRKNTLKKIIFGVFAKIGKALFSLPLLNRFEHLAKKALYKAAQSPDYAKTNGIERDIFKKVIRQDISNLLPEIKTPTLVIWGDKDSYVPLIDGVRIASTIPNAKLQIITGASHGLHQTHPADMLSLITHFISSPYDNA